MFSSTNIGSKAPASLVLSSASDLETGSKVSNSGSASQLTRGGSVKFSRHQLEDKDDSETGSRSSTSSEKQDDFKLEDIVGMTNEELMRTHWAKAVEKTYQNWQRQQNKDNPDFESKTISFDWITQEDPTFQEQHQEMIQTEFQKEEKRFEASRQKRLNDFMETLKDSSGKSSASPCLETLATVCMLFIVISCEFDVFGYLVGLPSFWGSNSMTNGLLVVMPLAYFIVIQLWVRPSLASVFECLCDQQGQPLDDKIDALNAEIANIDPSDDKALRADNLRLDKLVKERQKQRTIEDQQLPKHERLKFYHYVPLVRLYVFLKGMDGNDVHWLLTINTVSSFTMGIGSLAGFFTLMVTTRTENPEADFWGHLDMTVWVTIGAWLASTFVTVINFTPIKTKMKVIKDIEKIRSDAIQEVDRHSQAIEDIVASNGESVEDLKGDGKEELRLELEAIRWKIHLYTNKPLKLIEAVCSPEAPIEDHIDLLQNVRMLYGNKRILIKSGKQKDSKPGKKKIKTTAK